MAYTKTPKSAWERIQARTLPPDENGCMNLDMNTTEKTSYRAMYIKENGKVVSVLRVVWEGSRGEPPQAGVQIEHNKEICKSKRCVNPKHIRERLSKAEEQMLKDMLGGQ